MAEYIEREAGCRKCFHYDACFYHITEETKTLTTNECPLFVNKADVVEIPQSGIGDLSDGYHTFNELYHHRAVLFSVICNLMPHRAWKSKLHDTGDMYDGMFIVGIKTPHGQATYHYDIDPYWDMFKVKELEKAPKWDGHTPQDAIERIAKLASDVDEDRHGVWLDVPYPNNPNWEPRKMCSICGRFVRRRTENYCPNCGAKMDGKDGAE